MKTLLSLFLAILAAVTVQGAGSFIPAAPGGVGGLSNGYNFNSSQFTLSGTNVTLKSGAPITNANLRSPVFSAVSWPIGQTVSGWTFHSPSIGAGSITDSTLNGLTPFQALLALDAAQTNAVDFGWDRSTSKTWDPEHVTAGWKMSDAANGQWDFIADNEVLLRLRPSFSAPNGTPTVDVTSLRFSDGSTMTTAPGASSGGGYTNLSWLHASLQATNPFAFSIWPSNVWGLYSGAPLFVYRQGPRVYLSGSITNSSSWGIYDELGAYPAPYAPQRGVRLVGLRYGGSPLSQTGGAETYLNAGAGRIYNLNDGGGTAQFIAFESSWPAASPFHAITNGGGGQVVLLIPDPAPTNGVTLAVYCHGFGQDAGQWAFDGNSLVALTNGFPVLSVSGGPSTWGNETNVVAFSNALRWVKSSFAVTNTVVFGGSMGGLTALNLMNRFPEISRFYGLYPVCSLTNAAWSASLSNSVKGAYGYTSPTAENYLTTAFPSDPAALSVTNWSGKRFWFVASTGDTLVPPANHSNVMTNRIISGGGTVHYYSHTGDHGDASAYVPTNVVAFLRGTP